MADSPSRSSPLRELDREVDRLRGLEGEINRGRRRTEPLTGELEGVNGRDAASRLARTSSALGLLLDELLICYRRDRLSALQ